MGSLGVNIPYLAATSKNLIQISTDLWIVPHCTNKKVSKDVWIQHKLIFWTMKHNRLVKIKGTKAWHSGWIFVVVVVIKHLDQKQLHKEGICLRIYFEVTSIIEGNQGRNWSRRQGEALLSASISSFLAQPSTVCLGMVI